MPIAPAIWSAIEAATERHINSIFMKLDLGDSENISRRVKAAVLHLAGQVG